MPAHEDATTTRAPGTPIRGLLDRVLRSPRRERSPRRDPTTALTPAEHIDSTNRVAQQIREFDHLSLPQDPSDQAATESVTFWNFLSGLPQTDKKRNDEISLKELSAEEKKLFEESDRLEWEAILQTKAVHVIYGEEAQKIRQQFSDRIVSSRMVRRKKPQPLLHSWKAKSRWCLHGHTDPDTGLLVTYAPTPQTEGIMLFLQTAINHQMTIAFADVKNAFCQSRPMKRQRGPIFAEPCPGLPLPPGALISIDVPVYGLDDAPAEWRATVSDFTVKDLKAERNVVEPCWYNVDPPRYNLSCNRFNISYKYGQLML